MESVIYNKNGDVDWNANGWPEPNPASLGEDGEFSIEGMPDEIFDIWLMECESLGEEYSID